jgi:hypothetical protein
MSDGRRHAAIILIFALFAALALAPTSYFTGKFIKGPSYYGPERLKWQALACPSTFFALFMPLAGILVWKLGLLPRGISSSFGRVLTGVLLALFIYPVGFLFILWTFLALVGFTEHSGLNHVVPGIEPDWQILLKSLPFTSIMWAGGALVVLHSALAFAITVRFWPRRAFFWAFGASALIIVVSLAGALFQHRLMFPTISVWGVFVRSTFDLFFAMAWNLQLPILIGEPILAGLLGHWLYLAAREYAIPSANLPSTN